VTAAVAITVYLVIGLLVGILVFWDMTKADNGPLDIADAGILLLVIPVWPAWVFMYAVSSTINRLRGWR
jgi:hypothetical protein